MEKTEMMKRYEAETGEILDIDHLSADTNGSWCGYIEELEGELRGLKMLNKWSKEELNQYQTKATAYDRLMSMNSISENDIQIVLDGNAWCAYRLPFRNLQEDNAGFGVTPQMALTALLESELPDGWEESK